MDGLKRRRSAQAEAMTKVFHKLQKAKTDGDDLLSNLQLERHITSLNSSFETYKQIHEELLLAHAEELIFEGEKETLEQQAEAYEEAEMLAQTLHSFRCCRGNQTAHYQVQQISNPSTP